MIDRLVFRVAIFAWYNLINICKTFSWCSEINSSSIFHEDASRACNWFTFWQLKVFLTQYVCMLLAADNEFYNCKFI